MVALSLRLCIYTEYGPVGFRLERGTALPVQHFDYPDTEEGREQAEAALEKLRDYVTRHHSKQPPARRR